MAAQFPRIAAAFPDFDVATLPSVPGDWEDVSWKNNACPSFGARGFDVFVDFANDEDRECPGRGRFTIMSESDTETLEIYNGDDWAEVLAIVNA